MLKVPHNWSEINIARFIDVYNAMLIPVNEGEDVDVVQREVNILAALCGVHTSVVEALTFKELRQYVSQLGRFDMQAFENIPLPATVKLNGVVYDYQKDMGKISAGQFIDFNNFTKDPDNIINNLANILAVLLVPRETVRRFAIFKTTKSGKYDGATHPQRAAMFKEDMPAIVAYPLCLFFLNVTSKSQKPIRDSLQRQLSKLRKTERKLLAKRKHLQKNGAGTLP